CHFGCGSVCIGILGSNSVDTIAREPLGVAWRRVSVRTDCDLLVMVQQATKPGAGTRAATVVSDGFGARGGADCSSLGMGAIGLVRYGGSRFYWLRLAGCFFGGVCGYGAGCDDYQ